MKNIVKFFILFLFCITTQAFAKDISIPSITIGENNQGYSVTLNTMENVKYKKVNESSDTTYFEIKNVKAKENIQINYNNTKTIENVTIQRVSSNKIRVYVKGEVATNSRLYINDIGGNPFYIEGEKFDGINGKNILLLLAGVLMFSIFMSSDKKEELQVARATYDNNMMLQNLKQNKIIRINDFIAKENLTNPIRSGDRENSLDLEMVRKSA